MVGGLFEYYSIMRKSLGGRLVVKRVVLSVLLLFCLVTIPVLAEPEGEVSEKNILMEIDAGFETWAKVGASMPLKVKLVNKGPDVQGEIRVTIPGMGDRGRTQHGADVVLPQGSMKEIILNLPVDAFNNKLTVSFVSGEKILAKKTQTLKQDENRILVGILSDQENTLNYLETIQLSQRNKALVKVIHLDGKTFPEKEEVLDTLDVLVINDFASQTLNEKQWGTIQKWVQGDNLLILGFGPNWKKTWNGLPEDLKVVNIAGTKQVSSLPGLEKFTGKDIPGGNYVLNSGELTDGSSALVWEGDNPVIASKPWGKGNVVYFALDLNLDPLVTWQGNGPLWSQIITMFGPEMKFQDMKGRNYPYGLFNALGSLPFNAIPSTWVLATLMIVYIGVLGFGNYFILKKFDKRELAWITIPLLVTLFASGVYFTGLKGKGRDIVASYINIVDVTAGQMRSYTGIFAPAKKSYHVMIPGNAIVHVGTDYDNHRIDGPANTLIRYGENTEVEMLDMNMWSMRSFYFQHEYAGGGITSNLKMKNGRIIGDITNNTGHDLRDVLLFNSGGSYKAFAGLKNGEVMEIDLPINFSGGGRRGGIPDFYQMFNTLRSGQQGGPVENERERQINRERQTLDGTFGWEGYLPVQGLVLVGFSEEPVNLGIEVNGKKPDQYSLNMFTTSLEINMAESDGNIPTGMITMKPIGGDAKRINQNPDRIGFAKGSIIFQGMIPSQIGAKAEELLFEIIYGNGSPTAQIYNWQTKKWDDFTINAKKGIGAKEHISSVGLVQVKLENNNEFNDTWVRSFSIGVKGGSPDA